jgi:hypothetical protein
MEPGQGKNGSAAKRLTRTATWTRKFSWVCFFIGLSALSILTSLSSVSQQTQPPPRPPKPIILPEANRLPDANDQMEMREELTRVNQYEAANSERIRQISSDSARLLKLAGELKADADKTDEDLHPLDVIQRAEEIEHLARNVQEKMKLTVGAK